MCVKIEAIILMLCVLHYMFVLLHCNRGGLTICCCWCYLSARLQDTMSSSTGSTIKKNLQRNNSRNNGGLFIFLFSRCVLSRKKGYQIKNTDPISFSVVQSSNAWQNLQQHNYFGPSAYWTQLGWFIFDFLNQPIFHYYLFISCLIQSVILVMALETLNQF